jgi:hypothetical protein
MALSHAREKAPKGEKEEDIDELSVVPRTITLWVQPQSSLSSL